ncbi:helicase-related protein [Dactylosporangium sp. CA-233914]|uniref:helicase-related protein n=1 Tax=Dactylosporangium sp. CA-233914 TaxID=3239934 RepID=UPI003D8D6021
MIDPKTELAMLKDFQRATAVYTFRRMYMDKDATTRFLVADEVGLGKTLVARAVIAQAVAHLHRRGDRRIDIVYVCSNSAIAEQNARKLAPSGLEVKTGGRLSLLPGQQGHLKHGVNIVALTPTTSLQHRTGLGQLRERALAHRFLSLAWGSDLVEDVGTYRVFAGEIGGKDGKLTDLRQRFATELNRRNLAVAHGTKGLFTAELKAVDRRFRAETDESLQQCLEWLAAQYRKGHARRAPETAVVRKMFVGNIRHALAATGAALLRPSLVIFDEFQRFADLLHDTDTDTRVLVERLIEGHARGNMEATRTLLLSATPYRMHTTDVERASGEEEHYRDLLRTIEFLTGEPGAPGLTADLRRLRQCLTRIPSDGPEPAREAAAEISARLRKVMVRTERLASTDDRNGMLATATGAVTAPSAQDIRAFVAAARLAADAAHDSAAHDHALVELWKSTPYLLSFLGQENYKVKRNVVEALEDPARAARLTRQLPANPAALRWKDIDRYRQVDVGNARLRRLLADIARPAAHRLLWVPPAAPYYEPSGDFAPAEARALTKRLVFSAWNAAPTAISALTSYEVERQTVGSNDAMRYGADANRRAPRPLRFAVQDGKPTTMTSYLVLHPSVALADAFDPLAIAHELRASGVSATSDAVLAAVADRLRPAVDAITFGYREGTTDPSWYWLALMMLDLKLDEQEVPTAFWLDGQDADQSEEDRRLFWQHLDYGLNVAEDATPAEIGAPPPDLLQVLAELAMGSPAITAIRAIRRVIPDADPLDVLRAAAEIAWAFRSMFNGAEATAILRRGDDQTFWRACLRYGVDGNLQAMLDEYVHVLAESQRYDADNIPDLSKHMATALTLRTASYHVDAVDGGRLVGRSMRGRYATRFDQGRDEEQAAVRTEHVMQAFNSPFWPFVLATTSIGQEGLDFHLYCHAVVHWNLPRNPVDLEQREGRVHRYKNHAVRKNVAAQCGLPVSTDGDPWQAMFEEAARLRPSGETEIMPYWVFPGDAQIERHLFVPPYTRDASSLSRLLASTALYRLAFGQPRQEELIDGLMRQLSDEHRKTLRDIQVDLRPPALDG